MYIYISETCDASQVHIHSCIIMLMITVYIYYKLEKTCWFAATHGLTTQSPTSVCTSLHKSCLFSIYKSNIIAIVSMQVCIKPHIVSRFNISISLFYVFFLFCYYFSAVSCY